MPASAALGLCLLLAACGKKDATGNLGAKMAGGAAKKPAAATAPASAPATSALSRPAEYLSMFSTNDPRDPFHPKVKIKSAQAAAASTENEPTQISKALETGFQGIYGSLEDRVALIYGILLQEKKEAFVNVPMEGKVKRVKIKALRILRNAVELQVEGVPQVVTLTKARR